MMDATFIRYFRIGFIFWNAFISAAGIFAMAMIIFAMPWQGVEEYEAVVISVFLIIFIAVYALVSFLNAKLQLRTPSTSLISGNGFVSLIVLGLIFLDLSAANSDMTLLLPLAGNSAFCFLALLFFGSHAATSG